MIGAPLGRAGGKPQRNSLLPAKDRGGLGRLDVVARFKVWGRYRKYHWGADLAERLQIGAVGHVIAEVSAHERGDAG